MHTIQSGSPFAGLPGAALLYLPLFLLSSCPKLLLCAPSGFPAACSWAGYTCSWCVPGPRSTISLHQGPQNTSSHWLVGSALLSVLGGLWRLTQWARSSNTLRGLFPSDTLGMPPFPICTAQRETQSRCRVGSVASQWVSRDCQSSAEEETS